MNENLSDIDDKEDSNFFLSKEEFKLKEMIWDVLFKDWTDDQKQKNQEKKEIGKKRPRKTTTELNMEEAKSPEEAIIKSKKFGKKLNPNKINNYLFKRNKPK